MKHSLIILSLLLLQGCIKKESPPKVVKSPKYESVSQCVIQTMKERELTGNKMFEMVKKECERSLVKVENGEKKRKGVLFFINRDSKWGYYKNGDEKKDDKYVGEIENEKPNGQGTVTYSKGGKYEGEWKDGLPNGQGTISFPDGSNYVGGWKDGTWDGRGIETRSDGSKYVGEYKNWKIHGLGTYTWSDGTKYGGEWKDGKRDGHGTMILHNGEKYVGEWKNGKPWNVTHYDKDGNILWKFVEGKKIKQ